MSDSFTLLRASARSRNRKLSDLARGLVDGTEHVALIDPAKPPRSR
jgi:hypothetical protein